MKDKLLKKIDDIRKFLLNPHLMICYGIAWIITNGWAYIGIGLGSYYEIEWLKNISVAYLAILWSPFCFELIATLIITIALMKRLFPQDKETLKRIQVYYRYYRLKVRAVKRERRKKREERLEKLNIRHK
ncbi:MAG TPA: hypothetical protein P5191_14630 [Ruminococcus sp.]|nr:hypothetical protein [Ruminococcus sp.]